MATPLGIFDVLKMIFILVIILICTYYATKLLAAKASGASSFSAGKFFAIGNAGSKNNVYPTVIHQLMIDKESRFVLLEYNGYDYLIAMTSGGVHVIEKRELSQEELAERKQNGGEDNKNSFDFASCLEKFKNISINKGGDDN